MNWQVATPTPGELRVCLLRPVLEYDHVRPLFDWLLSNHGRSWRTITLDFANVRVAAPWAPVFAHLEYVASRSRADCRLVGMNPRLARMASFAMCEAVRCGPSIDPDGAAPRLAEIGERMEWP